MVRQDGRWVTLKELKGTSLEIGLRGTLFPLLKDQYRIRFFEKEGSYTEITIYTYSGEHLDKHALLLDRSFLLLDNDDARLTFEFNLTSNAFITYSFNNAMNSESKIPKIKIEGVDNDLESLSTYNQNVVGLSFNKIYCKSNQIYGL